MSICVIKLLILVKFMRGGDKPITATERMKAQTRHRTQNPWSNATKTFHAKKVLRKARKRQSVQGRSQDFPKGMQNFPNDSTPDPQVPVKRTRSVLPSNLLSARYFPTFSLFSLFSTNESRRFSGN